MPAVVGHADSMDRVEPGWRAWEGARPGEHSVEVAHWWLTIADPMLAVLLDADVGRLSACRRDGHQGAAGIAAPVFSTGVLGQDERAACRVSRRPGTRPRLGVLRVSLRGNACGGLG